MPRALIATLCDDVREEVHGKNSLMGVFNQFRIADFRNPVNTFWIFARIEFEEEGEFPFAFEFRAIEGQSLFRITGAVNVRGQSGSNIPPVADLKFRADGLRFPRHGIYELAIFVKEKIIQTVPVEVITAKSPYVQ